MSQLLMTHEQVLQIMSKTIQELNLEMDLSDYVSRGDFNSVYTAFESALADKVNVEIYNQKMSDIETSIGEINNKISEISTISNEEIDAIF